MSSSELVSRNSFPVPLRTPEPGRAPAGASPSPEITDPYAATRDAYGATRARGTTAAAAPVSPRAAVTPSALTPSRAGTGVVGLSLAAVAAAGWLGAKAGTAWTSGAATGASAGNSVALALWTAMAAATYPILKRHTAPYGRHARPGWGPELPSRLGWILMEAPSALVMAGHAMAAPALTPASGALVGLWELHYINRTAIYPMRLRCPKKPMPLVVAASGLVFNLVSGWFNGANVTRAAYAGAWLTDPRFLLGTALFAAGFAINQHADDVLLNLRKPGETGYKIPHGGLFEYVSCPNYLGELMEWTGWAIATWSLPGVAFAVWTALNLAPRAESNHADYHKRFPDYPKDRRALLPGLW
jgi:3-oxo-5-alpha-steroid 4-dehydrogenase 1